MIGRESGMNVYASVIACISLFVIFFIDSSFYFVNNVSGFFRIILICIALVVFSICKWPVFCKFSHLVIFLFLCSLSALQNIVEQNIIQVLNLLVIVGCSFVVTQNLEEKKFVQYFCKFIRFISIYSLVVFFIGIFVPSLIEIFPISKIEAGRTFYNTIFSIFCQNSYVSRNYGLFWEPGAFAIFLNIALFFELFVCGPKKTNILLLVLALLSTLSTTGYACMLLLFVSFFISCFKKGFDLRLFKYFCFFIFFAAFLIYFCQNEYIWFHVFGKLESGFSNTSTETRFDAFVYPIKFLMDSPLMGIGFNDFLEIQEKYCHGMATATFVNWVAIFGFVIGSIFIVGICIFFLKYIDSFWARILIVLFVFVLFSSENFVQITFIYLLFFYGIVPFLPSRLK